MADSTTLVSGMALGGVFLSILGTGTTVFVEKKDPSVKSVARDFIIGAVLIAVVMQILPESTTSLIKSVVGLLPLAALSSMKGGSLKTLTGGGSTESTFDDMEVQVGVPRF